MRGSERRDAIIEELRGAGGPVSGSSLAKAVGVSRQVVVQDIALLRADGHDVVATSRGYVLLDGRGEPQVPTRLVKVCHGAVLNVMVNHRVYGKITGDLDIRNRRDIEHYLENIRSGKSFPLLTVTSGYHFHRIAAESEEQLDEIEAALREKGYLAEVMPYEGDLQ